MERSNMGVKQGLFRYLPLLLLMIVLLSAFYFKLYQYLSFGSLKQHRQFLLEWTEQHYILAVISYICLYVMAVAISIPGAAFLTLVGGFLFGLAWGTFYVVFSATLGATLLFLAVNTAFGKWLEKRASGGLSKMESGFKKHAFNYLLTLRLIPLFPFWLVNIVPALLNIPLRTFVVATLIGIIPGSLVYVSLGSGLNAFFDAGTTPDIKIIFSPPVLLPLLGLAILSLVPILYKHVKGKNDKVT
jgi:uncharacterized membrane protein YdjX (TVP38/TMEM64 family)